MSITRVAKALALFPSRPLVSFAKPSGAAPVVSQKSRSRSEMSLSIAFTALLAFHAPPTQFSTAAGAACRTAAAPQMINLFGNNGACPSP